MATYSFSEITATLTGAAGLINLGSGSANTKEGITIALAQDRNQMTVGADGEYMHSLRCDKSGQVTVRLLLTSPINALLQVMYDAQALAPSAWGNNVLVIINKGNLETTTCRGVAFKKQPDITYDENGAYREWAFDCGKIDTISGTY